MLCPDFRQRLDKLKCDIFFRVSMSLYSSDTRLSRQRQITTLKVYSENVEEVIENSEYRVKVKCGTLQLALVVRLPPEFPDIPPVVLCSPPLLHPWISTGGRVTGLTPLTPE